VGYTISAQGIKVAVAMDLGYIPDSLRIPLRQTDFLLLESNHDAGAVYSALGGG
jgi:hypothetical protein